MYLNGFIRRASQNIFEYQAPVDYLQRRGLNADDIRKYSLGFVRYARIPNDGSDDYKALFNSTYELRALQNKILFPLKNILGHVNGLVVRSMEKKLYKQYFMSEARAIGAFFGLYEALPYIQKTGKVFVHEGAFDAISFAKVYPNTVSSLTSFLNEQQFETLRFFADKIILVYDNDKAGHIGADKTIETYGEKNVEIVYLGDDDSNKYLQMMGFDRFRTYVKSKIPSYLT